MIPFHRIKGKGIKKPAVGQVSEKLFMDYLARLLIRLASLRFKLEALFL